VSFVCTVTVLTKCMPNDSFSCEISLLSASIGLSQADAVVGRPHKLDNDSAIT